MSSLHVFDSDIWIRFARNHPIDIFVSLWDRIDDCVKDGQLISPVEVAAELDKGVDGLAKELKLRHGLFVPLDDALQLATTDVLAQCPSLADPDSEHNRADPFVVALAKIRGGCRRDGGATAKVVNRSNEDSRCMQALRPRMHRLVRFSPREGMEGVEFVAGF
jgi:hypothetical protein